MLAIQKTLPSVSEQCYSAPGQSQRKKCRGAVRTVQVLCCAAAGVYAVQASTHAVADVEAECRACAVFISSVVGSESVFRNTFECSAVAGVSEKVAFHSNSRACYHSSYAVAGIASSVPVDATINE